MIFDAVYFQIKISNFIQADHAGEHVAVQVLAVADCLLWAEEFQPFEEEIELRLFVAFALTLSKMFVVWSTVLILDYTPRAQCRKELRFLLLLSLDAWYSYSSYNIEWSQVAIRTGYWSQPSSRSWYSWNAIFNNLSTIHPALARAATMDSKNHVSDIKQWMRRAEQVQKHQYVHRSWCHDGHLPCSTWACTSSWCEREKDVRYLWTLKSF